MKLPHQLMLDLALGEEDHLDVIITKDGEVQRLMRPLSIKERIELLKACASYYAPQMKAIEAKATLDLDSMDLDQLKAKVITIMSKTINDERKAH